MASINRRHSLSIQAKLGLLLLLIGIVNVVLTGSYLATGASTYLAAEQNQRVAAANQGLFAALQSWRLERGATLTALALPSPAPSQDIGMIAPWHAKDETAYASGSPLWQDVSVTRLPPLIDRITAARRAVEPIAANSRLSTAT